MFIITLILGLFVIYFIVQGEDKNHYLYSLYISICGFINLFVSEVLIFEDIIGQIKENPIILTGQLFMVLLTLYIPCLISFKISANTTSSSFTYFIKFIIVSIVVYFVFYSILGLIFN